jgi:putative DNA primase/helicase
MRETSRFVPQWGWMHFDGRKWAHSDLAVRQAAGDVARGIYAEAAAERDTERQKAIASWAQMSQAASRIRDAIWLAQPILAADPADFDCDPMLLSVANGVIDLHRGTLRPHDAADMITRTSLVQFDESASCPRFEQFLQHILPDEQVRAYIQRLAGYALTGKTTEQVVAIFLGSGQNGKSVLRTILESLLGDLHVTTRVESLSMNRSGGVPNDVAAFAGARLITTSEVPDGMRLNESLIKDFSGGDVLTARFLNKEYFQFKPQALLLLTGNHKPRISGTDHGIWRRIHLVDFPVRIAPSEVDPELPEKLEAELPGILNWAVRGCLEWQRLGLCPPESVTASVSEYRAEMDTLGEFLTECCVVDSNAKAKASELYALYRAWSERAGHHPVSSTRFGISLGDRGFQKVKAGTVSWRGIGLLSQPLGQLDSLDSSPGYSFTRARNGKDLRKLSELSKLSGSLSDCPRCAGEGCGFCDSENNRRFAGGAL